MDLLSFFFPKYCVGCKKTGGYLCTSCFAKVTFAWGEKCLVCGRGAVDGITHPPCRKKETIDGSFAVLSYKGVVKKLLYTFKYKPYVTDLSKLLGDFFYEGLIQKELFVRLRKDHAIFVPIPLSLDRKRMRGYNQTELLAKELATHFCRPVQKLLIRTKKTHTQVGLDKETRKENIKGAFSAAKGLVIQPDTIIFLVDDVITTGATLLEAAKICKKQGAKAVYGLSLAIG